jgi:hypothetical protein
MIDGDRISLLFDGAAPIPCHPTIDIFAINGAAAIAIALRWLNPRPTAPRQHACLSSRSPTAAAAPASSTVGSHAAKRRNASSAADADADADAEAAAVRDFMKGGEHAATDAECVVWSSWGDEI